jgi:hypothetical protein
VLPHSQDKRAIPPQFTGDFTVAFAIPADLRLPELASGAWDMSTLSAAMPKAPIDEDREPMFWEIEVWPAQDRGMQCPASYTGAHQGQPKN